MFRWAIIFAVIALIASLLGFGGVAGLSKDFAIILLVIAVILAIGYPLALDAKAEERETRGLTSIR